MGDILRYSRLDGIGNSHKGYRKRTATEMLFFMLRSGQ